MKNGVNFQRRHFEFIAKVISEIGADDVRCTTALRFAGELQATNANFDWEKFMAACRVPTNAKMTED